MRNKSRQRHNQVLENYEAKRIQTRIYDLSVRKLRDEANKDKDVQIQVCLAILRVCVCNLFTYVM